LHADPTSPPSAPPFEGIEKILKIPTHRFFKRQILLPHYPFSWCILLVGAAGSLWPISSSNSTPWPHKLAIDFKAGGPKICCPYEDMQIHSHSTYKDNTNQRKC